MKKKGKIISIVISALILGIAGYVFYIFYKSGSFKDIQSHCECSCQRVEGVVGPEDITIDEELAMAFISSDDRRAYMEGDNIQGAIFEYDLNNANAQPVNISKDFDKEFHPHGFYLYKEDNGDCYLFVINHRSNGHYVEIFQYDNHHLTHLESITDDKMISPNDICAIAKDQFYITNDHGTSSGIARILEEYLMLPLANIAFYDGEHFTIAAEGLTYANGININKAQDTLYVASLLDHSLFVYQLDRETCALSFDYSIEVGTGLDNIELDNQGNLYLGCHPKLLTFVEYSKNKDLISPSQIIKITLEEGQWDTQEIYLNDGEEISGSSVAAIYNNTLLIGSVFDEYFLRCEME